MSEPVKAVDPPKPEESTAAADFTKYKVRKWMQGARKRRRLDFCERTDEHSHKLHWVVDRGGHRAPCFEEAGLVERGGREGS